MAVGKWLRSEVILPGHEWIMRRPTFRYLRELLASRALGRDGIRALQERKLRRLLIHSFETTAFYRDRVLDSGCDPRHDDPWRVLAALPLLTRQDIRDNLDRMRSTACRRARLGTTSGSSGTPLRFVIGPERMASDKAARLRAQLDWGVPIGERKVWLWGMSLAPSWADRLKNLRDWLTREYSLNAYDMTPDRIRQYAACLRRWRPSSVTCYPSAAWRLCRFAEDEGIDLRPACVAVWFCTGETLEDHYREVIERVSGGGTANEYGMREAGFIAHACPAGTIHVMPEIILAETIRPDGTPAGDAVGEIVVTNLDGLAMPLIRYQTGDVACLEDSQCPCGWQTQSLRSLVGRRTSFLISADGTPRVGFAASRAFANVPGVQQFQLIQESLQLTRIVVVPSATFGPQSEEMLRSILHRLLGSQVRVSIERTSEIPCGPGGKTCYIYSNIAGDYL